MSALQHINDAMAALAQANRELGEARENHRLACARGVLSASVLHSLEKAEHNRDVVVEIALTTFRAWKELVESELKDADRFARAGF